jgi:hypothetical protein
MLALELIALSIVTLFVVVRARFGPEPRKFLVRLAILVVASWVVEDSVIRAYGFYHYNPGWSLFVDHVPLAILLIWPIVIHSAWELAQHLRRTWISLVGGALVLADASMIEPIAVHSGLWTWTEPGLFDVPPIGIIGWAYYAALCMFVFERVRERSVALSALIIVVAPIGTHLLLLASWWGLFRWINAPLPPWPFVIMAWVLAVALAGAAIKRRSRELIPRREMFSRVPAALFFFGLLALDARDAPPLIAWALAFALPYLALTRFETAPTSAAYEGRK